MKKLLVLLLTALLLLCSAALAQADTYAVVVDTQYLNLRSGPASSYTWLGKVARGEWVRVLGQSGNWYRVEVVGEDLTGYMSKNFLDTFEGGYAGSSNVAVVNNPVSTHWLNLRRAPSYDAEVLEIFFNGEQCTILQRMDGWYYVSAVKNGQTLYGYFRSEYLKVAPATSGTPYRVSTANGGWLNLRSAPSYEADVLAAIPNGAQVNVVLEGKEFCQVMYNGTAGFVGTEYIKPGTGSVVNPGKPQTPASGNAVVRTGNSGKLNLREQYSANAKILGQYANGTQVRVINKGAAWSLVEVGTQRGYMMTKYLQFNTTMSTNKYVYNPNGGTYVNLRTAPEKTSGNVNVRVPVNTVVTVLAWGDEWSQIQYNSYTGYMMSWFLK